MTLKNAAWLLGVLIVIFMAISTWNEHRPRDSSRGPLSGGNAEVPRATAPPAARTIDEPPIADRTFAVGGGANPLAPQAPSPPPAAAVAASEPSPRVTLKEARQRGKRIVVTGGPEGVRADAKPAATTATETAVPPPQF